MVISSLRRHTAWLIVKITMRQTECSEGSGCGKYNPYQRLSACLHCYHHSIPVRAILSKRGMDVPFLCPMCNNAPETIIHTLRDCPTSQSFWTSLSPPFQRCLFYGANLVSWVKLTYQSSKTSIFSCIDWSVLFPFAL